MSKRTNNKNEVMLIYNQNLSVTPITTHVPIKYVSKQLKQTKIKNNILKIDKFFKNYLPSPFSIAILLTLLTILFAYLAQSNESSDSILEIVQFWERGIWDKALMVFALQMMLMLVLGYSLALSKPIENFINYFLKFCGSNSKAALIITLLTILISLLNWGLGLIFGAIFVKKVGIYASKNNIKKFITHIAPCIEVVGYRQKKKGIKSLGDLCSDFGANVKFVVGSRKKFKNNNVKNLNTNISNYKINHSVSGNTNTVYFNPMNSLLFVLRKLQQDKIKHDKDFYIFTGSSVGVVKIQGKGIYKGKIKTLGTVTAKIN